MGKWAILGCLAILGTGCNRQDTEGLSRIGKKIAERSQTVMGKVRTSFDLKWQSPGKESTLQDRVAQRLKQDVKLASAVIDVTGQGNEVVLKGKVQSQEQRDRAADLAQNTVGVERVQVELETPPPPPDPDQKKENQ